MIHSIIIGQGEVTVTGQLDLMEDEPRTLLRFYAEGKLQLTYALVAYREDELLPYEDSLDVPKLCLSVKNFIVDLDYMTPAKQFLVLGDDFDWYINNHELVEGMAEECNDILKIDKGWRYYSDYKYL